MKAFFLAISATLLASAIAVPAKRAAQFTGQPLQITNLVLADSSANNTRLNFTVHDPDPLTNATTRCSGLWEHGTQNYPTGSYLSCLDDKSIAWNMASYTSIENFTLGIEHEFTDPSVGSPPYDSVITFAHAPVNTSNVACDVFSGTLTCRQKAGTVISAKIYAAAA